MKEGFAIVYYTEYGTTEVALYQAEDLAHAFLKLLIHKKLNGFMFPGMRWTA